MRIGLKGFSTIAMASVNLLVDELIAELTQALATAVVAWISTVLCLETACRVFQRERFGVSLSRTAPLNGEVNANETSFKSAVDKLMSL